MKGIFARARRSLARLLGMPRELESLSGQIEALSAGLETLQQEIRHSRVREQRGTVDKGTQILLAERYRAQADAGKLLPFRDVEFRNYSQNGEDGILLYVFALIGTTNKYCVEICAGNGLECNTANLIINHGWHGLLVDGDPKNVNVGKNFYRKHPNTRYLPPEFQQQWITAENVDEFIASHGIKGEIDLLSLDIDGVDYWLWKAITGINPRVVILEFNAVWEAERSVTVPYAPDFQVKKIRSEGREVAHYCGASLPAFVKLAAEKGYRLVGSNLYGFNAVFVRNDLRPDLLPEVSAASCFTHGVAQWAHQQGRPHLEGLEWVEI